MLTRYVSVGKEVLAGLGVAARMGGVLFIILDFVNHNWVGGNVWCVGIGGGKTLRQWTDVAQSVSCHKGGNVWLYA